MRYTALLLWLVVTTAGAESALFLRAQTQAEGARLRLADVARPEGVVDAALMNLDIGTAPALGETRTIARDELDRWIATAGLVGPEQWRGNESIKVTRRAAVLDRHKLAATAKMALTRALDQAGLDYRVDAAGSSLPDQIPAGSLEVRVRSIDVAQDLSSRMLVWTELWLDGRFYRALPLAFRVQAYAQVLKARVKLQAGMSVGPDDFYVDRADIAAAGSGYWPADEPMARSRALRAIAAGDVLMRAGLLPLPQVERGNEVGLRVRAGTVVINTTARALEDGWQDRMVKVMPLNATRAVIARVTGYGRVEVAE